MYVCLSVCLSVCLWTKSRISRILNKGNISVAPAQILAKIDSLDTFDPIFSVPPSPPPWCVHQFGHLKGFKIDYDAGEIKVGLLNE